MSPDDPRHGTIAGQEAHRYAGQKPCEPCRQANVIYQRRTRALNGITPLGLRSARGTRRRIQALMTIGWSGQLISDASGIDQKQLWHVMKRDLVTKKTADAISATYDRLCMSIPPTRTKGERIGYSKARALAARRGWLPPLAWDDIDTDPEPPHADPTTDIDPVVVMRLLEGAKVPASVAEKEAAMAQWLAGGGSERELCEWHGWKGGRYTNPGLRLVQGGAA